MPSSSFVVGVIIKLSGCSSSFTWCTTLRHILDLYQDTCIPCFLDLLFYYKELMDDVGMEYSYGFQIAQSSVLTLRIHGSNNLKY